MSQPAKERASTNAMWGGRFAAAPAQLMQDINVSIDVDKRMWREDVRASRAHARMLGQTGILSAADVTELLRGLDLVWAELEAGTFPFRREYEDIHLNIEARLKELIGEVAGRLHTARSRNDQVVTDFRLWLRGAIAELDVVFAALQEALTEQAENNKNTIMPGFTHLQVAQPVTLALHLGAYVHMLGRDRARMADFAERLNECPLGACALAGTSFPHDRAMTAAELGFRAPMVNTMDAVGARDFVLEFLAAASICGVHLSRLAEELILWTSQPFGFVRLHDSYTTGSSIMPQKRNADAAELVRGKAGQLIGGLVQMLTLMKGLPMTYNKDMQDDKATVFAAVDTLGLCLSAMAGMIRTLEVNPPRMAAVAEAGYATATELADWLVRQLNLPFREAHHVTGRIVKLAEQRGCKLAELTLAEMQAIEPRIMPDIFAVLSAQAALKARGLID